MSIERLTGYEISILERQNKWIDENLSDDGTIIERKEGGIRDDKQQAA